VEEAGTLESFTLLGDGEVILRVGALGNSIGGLCIDLDFVSYD